MKILIISNMYPSEEKPYSGIFVKNQCEYLKYSLNQDIDIYTMKRSFNSKLGSILKYLKFYFLFFPYFFKKIDIIHIHFFGYHSYLAYIYKILHPKTKIVVTFHGSDTKNINNKLFSFILQKINIIIAVGKDQSEYIDKRVNDKKIKIIPAGINEQIFFKDDNIMKKYDFIFIGSFYEIKGIDIFIESIKKLNNKNLKYCFVGSGKYLSEIEKLKGYYNITVKENQRQSKIRILINQSKWLVLPSRGDSFGLVVSEAMYCATPVIVSNIGGMKDQVADGYNGFIIEENTPKCLAKKMEEVLKIEAHNYKKLQQNCINSNEEYSLDNICNKLLQIYKELLNEK